MIHSDTASMLRESVPEMLHVAKNCLTNRKPNGGCYGYPLVVLLFSVVDTIGSYHEDSEYEIVIGGRSTCIGKDYKHFYILNGSDYYGQNFTENEIKKLYDNFRSVLNHNLTLPPNHTLIIGEPMDPLLAYDRSKHQPIINVAAFVRLSEIAVNKFLQEIDSIVPESKYATNIAKKSF